MCHSEAKDLGLYPSRMAAGPCSKLPRVLFGFLVFQGQIFSHACVSIWWILKHLTDVNYHLRSAVLGPLQSVAGGPFCNLTTQKEKHG